MNGGWLELESDPGLFSLLVQEFGVKGVQVEEIYDLQKPVEGPVYGFIFLFKWIEERRARRKVQALDDNAFVRDQNVLREMFFAHQVVPNSCATHALLSILLNCSEVELGKTLSEFKDFTKDFTPECKGYAIGNMPEISKVHNSHAHPEPPRLPEKQIGLLAKKSSADTFHFVSYVPLNGRLYELDGLKPYPIDHGPWSEKEEWTEKFRRVMCERLDNEGGTSDIRFNLMAVVSDRLESYEQKLASLKTNRQIIFQAVQRLIKEEQKKNEDLKQKEKDRISPQSRSQDKTSDNKNILSQDEFKTPSETSKTLPPETFKREPSPDASENTHPVEETLTASSLSGTIPVKCKSNSEEITVKNINSETLSDTEDIKLPVVESEIEIVSKKSSESKKRKKKKQHKSKKRRHDPGVSSSRLPAALDSHNYAKSFPSGDDISSESVGSDPEVDVGSTSDKSKSEDVQSGTTDENLSISSQEDSKISSKISTQKKDNAASEGNALFKNDPIPVADITHPLTVQTGYEKTLNPASPFSNYSTDTASEVGSAFNSPIRSVSHSRANSPNTVKVTKFQLWKANSYLDDRKKLEEVIFALEKVKMKQSCIELEKGIDLSERSLRSGTSIKTRNVSSTKKRLEEFSHDLENNLGMDGNPFTPRELLELLKSVEDEIHSYELKVQDETEKRNKYKLDDCRRTHNYDPFIFTFLSMLAEQGKLTALIEKHSHSLSKARQGMSMLNKKKNPTSRKRQTPASKIKKKSGKHR